MPYKDKEKAKEYNREYKKKWRKDNLEHALEMERNRGKKHREKYRNANKRCYYKYREKNIDRVIKSNRARYRDRRLTCIEHYGNKCVCCGENNIEFLAIDHIYGGGKKHREEIAQQNMNIWEYLIKNNFPKEFRILCHNCNSSIGFYGYCPHQIERGEITRERANEIIEELRIKKNEAKKKPNTTTPD